MSGTISVMLAVRACSPSIFPSYLLLSIVSARAAAFEFVVRFASLRGIPLRYIYILSDQKTFIFFLSILSTEAGTLVIFPLLHFCSFSWCSIWN
jgi:hypothetical protein